MGDEVVRTTRTQSMQMAGVIAGTALGLNLFFFLMSGMYFDDRPKMAGDIGSVRAAFAIMSFLVAGMAYAAGVAPRLVGHGLALAVGGASFVGGIAGLMSTLPVVMSLTLILCGLLLPALAYSSLKHSRSAWAFLIAILAVLATVTFFGAPKIRHVLGIGLWHALIIPGLQIVAVIALTMLRGEYRNRA
jgi:hypothetical protein